MYKRILILSAIAISMIACHDHGEVYVRNSNGNVVEHYFITPDSIKNGLYQAYYDNGEVQEKSFYKDGKLDGERMLYFDNGGVEISEAYVEGVMTGPYKVYYKSGQVQLEQNFENGQLTGTSIKYHENGKLAEEVSFVDGEENGPFKEYYPNGEVHWEGNYLNGDNEFGLLKEYDESGELIKKMECDSMAICRTVWTKEKGDIIPKY